MFKHGNRNAFTIVELSLVLVLFGIVLAGSLRSLASAKRTHQLQKELDFYQNFEIASKTVFEQIIDTYEPICSNVSSDAQTGWGWSHTSCRNTSPLPYFLSVNKIRYDLNLANLSAAQASILEDTIIASYSPYCTFDGKTNTTLDLFCPSVSALTYDFGSGAVAKGHTLTQDISPLTPPVMSLSFEREENNSIYSTQVVNIQYLDVFEKRRRISNEKLNTIRNVMKTYYNSKLAIEVTNAPTTGLNSTDDAFVPWFWEIFGDSAANVIGSICNTSGGATCANLNNDNIWRTTLVSNALYIRRVITNLLSGDTTMSVDGFGNKLTLYPFTSQCAANDFSTCAVVAPPVPQQIYYNIMRPPYSSVLFIDSFRNKTVTSPDYGRVYITY